MIWWDWASRSYHTMPNGRPRNRKETQRPQNDELSGVGLWLIEYIYINVMMFGVWISFGLRCIKIWHLQKGYMPQISWKIYCEVEQFIVQNEAILMNCVDHCRNCCRNSGIHEFKYDIWMSFAQVCRNIFQIIHFHSTIHSLKLKVRT